MLELVCKLTLKLTLELIFQLTLKFIVEMNLKTTFKGTSKSPFRHRIDRLFGLPYGGKVGGGATQGTWRGSRPEALTPLKQRARNRNFAPG